MFDAKEQALLDAARQAKADPRGLFQHQREILEGVSESAIDHLTKPLTAEEKAIVERKKAAIKKLLTMDESIKARFKVEFFAGKDRSVDKPFRGSVLVFRSGTALHGGGDEIVYPCVDPACPGFIPPELISGSAAMAGCPKCQRVWPQAKLTEMFLAILPVQKWAYVLSRYFVRLGHDADLYMKFAPVDIRKSTVLEKSTDRGGTELATARHRRQPVIYPLVNIYKDLSAGADLEHRFRAFLAA